MPKKKSTKKKAVAKPTTTIALPTKNNVPPSSISQYNWAIYGEKGIGKSTLAACFPNICAHFMFEPLRFALETPLIPQQGEQQLNWNRFNKYIDMVVDRFGDTGSRVIIDTVDLAAVSLERTIAISMGVDSIYGLNDFGKTWDIIKTTWNNTVSKLTRNGIYITTVSHARKRPKNIKGLTREELQDAAKLGIVAEETQASCCGWANDWIKQSIDFVGYYGWDAHDRILTVRGSGDIQASAGVDKSFRQPAKSKVRPGSRIYSIPMGKSGTCGYTNLEDAFSGAIEVAEDYLEPLDVENAPEDDTDFS